MTPGASCTVILKPLTKAGEPQQPPQPASLGLEDRKSSASLTKKATTSNRKLLPFLPFRASISFFVLKSIPCLQPNPSPPLLPRAQMHPQPLAHLPLCFLSNQEWGGGGGQDAQADRPLWAPMVEELRAQETPATKSKAPPLTKGHFSRWLSPLGLGLPATTKPSLAPQMGPTVYKTPIIKPTLAQPEPTVSILFPCPRLRRSSTRLGRGNKSPLEESFFGSLAGLLRAFKTNPLPLNLAWRGTH